MSSQSSHSKKGRLSAKAIAAVYAKKGCNITATCEILSVSRRTFYNWREKRPELDQLCKDAEESLLDFAESKLIEHNNDGDKATLMFLLRTKGRNRGYVEKTETDITVNPFLDLMKAATASDGNHEK